MSQTRTTNTQLMQAIREQMALQREILETLKRTADRLDAVERTLYGEDGGRTTRGLVQDVDDLLHFYRAAVRVLWVVVTPLLAGIGISLVVLISKTGM